MVRLSPIDPSAPPTIPPGAAVRLRPVADWAGTDPGDRPLPCEFEEAGSGPRRFHWTADLDALVGQVATVDRWHGGLAVVGSFRCHPDWLAAVTADPAGEPCRCDSWALVNRGCSAECGRFTREMATR